MRPRDRSLAQQLDQGLRSFHRQQFALVGIQAVENRRTFTEQLLESIHRVRFISVISERDINSHRADPSSDLFDPLKAAILRKRDGNIDESFWLIFLSVHFGKHRRTGWRRVREVYGRLGKKPFWDWAQTSSNPAKFRVWLAQNGDSIGGHFGNHRKYESLKAFSDRGTGGVVESYVQWVDPPRTHQMLVQAALDQNKSDPTKTFDLLYHSMDSVASFGRTAKFDYLTMLGKLGLAPIEPGIPYLRGSTGPLKGARLLFDGATNGNLGVEQLDARLAQLGAVLNVGMQVLEDALCNWQKSPRRFVPFRG